MLNIKLLGKVKIEYDNKDVTEKFGAKTIALLSLLVINKNSVNRDKIITYLWPDSSEEAGKYNLRFNLWLIKSIIENDKNGNNFLRLERGFCGINRDYDFKCDIIEVSENADSDYRIKTVEELEAIRREYCGDFMEGFYFKNCNDYNEMILMERNYFENHKIKILMRLAQLYEEHKNYEDSYNILCELIQIQPYDEDVALKIINLYERREKYNSAILFYKNFKNKLVSSLGVQPSKQLQDKFDTLKGKDTASAEDKLSYDNKNEEKGKKRLHLEIFSLQNIKYHWMVEFLKALEKENIDIASCIPVSMQFDLAYIYRGGLTDISIEDLYRFKDCIPPEVRIGEAFILLIEELSETFDIIVSTPEKSALDSFSDSVETYLIHKGKIIIQQ